MFVVELANENVAIARELTLQVIQHAASRVEGCSFVPYLFGDVAGEDVDKHPLRMHIREVAAVLAAQALPFTQMALQTRFVRTLREPLKSPNTSHHDVLCPTLILMVEGTPQFQSIVVVPSRELQPSLIHRIGETTVAEEGP